MSLEPPPNFDRGEWKRWLWSPPELSYNSSYSHHTDTEQPFQPIIVSLLAFLLLALLVHTMLAPLHNVIFMLIASVFYVLLEPHNPAASDNSDIEVETGITWQGLDPSFRLVRLMHNKSKNPSSRRNSTEMIIPGISESDEEVSHILKGTRAESSDEESRSLSESPSSSVLQILKRIRIERRKRTSLWNDSAEILESSSDEDTDRYEEDAKARRIRRKLEYRRNNRYVGSNSVPIDPDTFQGTTQLRRRRR
ncbi:hypothetical protein F5B20DRAFT_241363 [Whalleya microplaca]|nr:hypothetical protein F5B20DRAFT_241363 [Whalleya microplaca]